jgi:hypothetical protein
MKAVGYVLAAGGVALANEILLSPLVHGKTPLSPNSVNWRIIPATAILALVIGGVGELNEGFGDALGALVLAASLLLPFGAGDQGPLSNLATVVQGGKL